MQPSPSMPKSIRLPSSSAPDSSQNTITTEPDALESNDVKPHIRIQSASHARFAVSPVLLQVPTSRETFDKLFEARAPPPVTVSSDRLVPTGSSREGSQSNNLHNAFSTSPYEIPLPPSPPPQSKPDSDFERPIIILRPPSPSQTGTRPKFDAPEPKVYKQITRRYLSPAYIRGESLPFAIKEVNEPETSESQYSVESALDFNDAPAGPDSSVVSRSTSQPLQSEEKADHSGDPVAEERPKSPQASGSTKSEDGEAVRRPSTSFKKGRTLLKQISPKKNIKSVLAMGRRLGIRRRLRSLRE